MKRLETLIKQAHQTLAEEYRFKPVNGVTVMEIARAVDRIREAEKVLRRAYP